MFDEILSSIHFYFDKNLELKKLYNIGRGLHERDSDIFYVVRYDLDSEFLTITNLQNTKSYYYHKFNINNLKDIVKFSQKLLKYKIFI
jgi:hypothetical protein